jgi:hypothetical protein
LLWAARCATSEFDVSNAAGWQFAKMKKRYTHLSPEFAKDVANALDFEMRKRGRKDGAFG